MLQRLFMIVLMLAVGWFLRRILGRAVHAGGGTAPRRVPPEASGGEMVRDRICNTFLPRSSALSSFADGREHFFCSERCRQSFIEGP